MWIMTKSKISTPMPSYSGKRIDIGVYPQEKSLGSVWFLSEDWSRKSVFSMKRLGQGIIKMTISASGHPWKVTKTLLAGMYLSIIMAAGVLQGIGQILIHPSRQIERNLT